MQRILKALGSFLAVLSFCAPFIFLPVNEAQVAGSQGSFVTVTIPTTSTVTSNGFSTSTTLNEETSSGLTSSTTSTTKPQQITIAAVGNVRSSAPSSDSFRDLESGEYDFSPIFSSITPYLRTADYTVANLEAKIETFEVADTLNLSPFTSINALSTDLKNAGVDLLAIANEYTLNSSKEALEGSLQALDAAEMPYIGICRSLEEDNKPFIVDIKGIKVAFLNYVDSTTDLDNANNSDSAANSLNAAELENTTSLRNTAELDRTTGLDDATGFSAAESQVNVVNVLDVEQIVADAASARLWGAHIVIALLHSSSHSEIELEPSDEQKEISMKLLEQGVDVILGVSSQRVQPISHVFEAMRATDKYVAYSLGDFVSDERWGYVDSSIVLYIHIEKRDLRARVTGVSYLPVYVQKGATRSGTGTRVLPVLPGLSPSSDIPLSELHRTRMREIWGEMRTLLYRPSEGILIFQPTTR